MAQQLWSWLRDHDLPNWIGLAFSLIAWPIILYWWSTRTRQAVAHLEVLPQSGTTIINEQQFDAVNLIFTNRTGSVAYIFNARLREHKELFPVPSAADKDLSEGWRELKFKAASSNNLDKQECIL
jgi:hypothetical protein